MYLCKLESNYMSKQLVYTNVRVKYVKKILFCTVTKHN